MSRVLCQLSYYTFKWRSGWELNPLAFAASELQSGTLPFRHLTIGGGSGNRTNTTRNSGCFCAIIQPTHPGHLVRVIRCLSGSRGLTIPRCWTPYHLAIPPKGSLKMCSEGKGTETPSGTIHRLWRPGFKEHIIGEPSIRLARGTRVIQQTVGFFLTFPHLRYGKVMRRLGPSKSAKSA